MSELLQKILDDCRPYTHNGRVASYIPELAKADRSKLGIFVSLPNGEELSAGDYDCEFTIQSVVKPIILLLALEDNGSETIKKICGSEATGKPFDAFNYSDRALTSEHINPMINAGAIVLCTLIKGDNYEDKFARLLSFTRRLADNPDLSVNEAVYLSEKSTGSKNRALAYMLKAYGMISGDIEEILDMYFKACSIGVSCRDLAKIAAVLAHHGTSPSGEEIVSGEHARHVNAIMTICGMYDGSGEFALKVGIPAKSGVGGGIMAVAPGRLGIGIFSPSLDEKGNSVAGIRALESISRELKLNIF